MSQYDKSYMKPSGGGNSTYNTWNTVPATIVVDSYNFANDAAKNKLTVNFEGEGSVDGDGVINGLGHGVLKDVVSIELVQASVPIITDITIPAPSPPELYVILNVNGYSRVLSNNNFTRKGFCTIHLQNPALDTFYTMKRTGSTPDDNYIYYFPEPTRLGKLDIEFLSGRANEVKFGGSNYSLTFEIRMLNRTPKPDSRFQQGVQGPW